MADDRKKYPGVGGELGPRIDQYDQPHGYARNLYDFSGRCVCGLYADDSIHVELYPGCPNPRFGETIVEYARRESSRWPKTLQRLGEDD